MKLPKPFPKVFLITGALLVLIACTRGSDAEVTQGVSARITPDTVSADAGDELAVQITVDPDGRGVSGGELNLSFDTDGLTLLKVEAGDLFGADPLVGVETVDNDTGTLTYALARRGETTPPTPTSVFAELTFQVSQDAARGSYDLSVTSLGLADESFQDIAGISLGSATVSV